MLEAQLTDAGLLDALVVPEKHLSEVKELLSEYPDRFLLPGPAAVQPIESLVPDPAGLLLEEAAICLRGISRSDLSDEQDLEHYFLEDLDLGFSELDKSLSLEECARQAVSRVQPADRTRTPEHMSDALRSNYVRLNNSLLGYHPEIRLVFDAPNQPAHLRQRLCILLKKGGKELSLYDFIQSLQTDIDTTGTILEERDRELFENILTETISHKLRARIDESSLWVRNMTALMATLTTSMGLTFSLEWKEKRSEGSGELDTAHLVTLLNKDRSLPLSPHNI